MRIDNLNTNYIQYRLARTRLADSVSGWSSVFSVSAIGAAARKSITRRGASTLRVVVEVDVDMAIAVLDHENKQGK